MQKAQNEADNRHIIHPSILTGNRTFVWLSQEQTMEHPQEKNTDNDTARTIYFKNTQKKININLGQNF